MAGREAFHVNSLRGSVLRNRLDIARWFRSKSGGRRSGSGRHGTRVASRLILLVVAVAVPLLCLSTLAIWRVHESERSVQEAALLEQARGLANLADREFERIE